MICVRLSQKFESKTCYLHLFETEEHKCMEQLILLYVAVGPISKNG